MLTGVGATTVRRESPISHVQLIAKIANRRAHKNTLKADRCYSQQLPAM